MEVKSARSEFKILRTGGSGNYTSLVSSPSSGTLASILDAQRSLPTLGEAEDLLVRPPSPHIQCFVATHDLPRTQLTRLSPSLHHTGLSSLHIAQRTLVLDFIDSKLMLCPPVNVKALGVLT